MATGNNNDIYKFIPIEKLELDKENPRIALKERNKEDYDILKIMWNNFSLEDLIISINQNGFIPAEPLMVIRKKNSDKYIVVEGNRRLSAMILLTNPKYKKDVFFGDRLKPYNIQKNTELPCYIFPKRENIQNALAVRHITGIKKWESKEKAEFIINLYKKDKDINKITRIIGSKTNTVGVLIYSYLWLDYLIESEDDNNKRKDLENLFENKFSLLNLALGQGNIKKFLNIKDKWETINYNIRIYKKGSREYDNMRYLCLWLSDNKLILDSRQITGGKNNPISLSAILGDEFATEYLITRTRANSELSNLLVEAYNRISVDSNLVVRFEEIYFRIYNLINLYKEKRSNLSENTNKDIKIYLDKITSEISNIN